MTGTLREDQYTFSIISCSVLLIMRNISDTGCRENQNTHFMINTIFFSKILPFYEVIWKNTVEPARHRRQYVECAFHAGYLGLQIHTQIM